MSGLIIQHKGDSEFAAPERAQNCHICSSWGKIQMFFYVITLSHHFVLYSVFVLMMVPCARTFTISSPLGLGTGHGMAGAGSVLESSVWRIAALARYGVTAHSAQVELMIVRRRKSCAHFILSLPTADLDTSAHNCALYTTSRLRAHWEWRLGHYWVTAPDPGMVSVWWCHRY